MGITANDLSDRLPLLATPEPGDLKPLHWRLVCVLALLLAVVPAMISPGENTWINDEPRLIANAFHANADHALATRGLRGNFGVSYGPTATQIYQLLLMVTHDPLLLASLRAGLSAGATALGILWLGRTLRLYLPFAIALVLIPFLWTFHRILWDASFAIPIGAIGLAAYASFLRFGGRGPLLISLICALLLPFIHPQDLPLALPILGHVVWRHWRALLRNWLGVLIVVGLVALLNWGYVHVAWDDLQWQLTHRADRGYPGTKSRVVALFAPLFSGRLLSSYRYAQADGRLLSDFSATEIAEFGTCIVYVLIWLGTGVAGYRAINNWRARREKVDLPPTPATVRDTLGIVILAGLAFHMLLYGAMRVPAEPQYFFGTFAMYALFAWIGVDALTRARLAGAATAVYGLSSATILWLTLAHMHRSGAEPNQAWPSLGDQMAVVRELNRHEETTALTDAKLCQQYPQSIRALRLLMPPASPGNPPRSDGGRPLLLYDASGNGPRLRLRWAQPGAAIPPGLTEMDVTPLQKGWEPQS